MRTPSITIALVALHAVAATSFAQIGVRAQSPRRDAGQLHLRHLAQSRANQMVHGRHYQFDGPSHIGSSSYDDGYAHYFNPSISIGGQFGDVFGKITVGGKPVHHKIVHVNRIPYAFYRGGYYRYDDYGYHNNRRQVVQSPTVIVIDRTGVSTNEVDPEEPITLEAADLVSARELGQQALYAGDAEQAVGFLTEHVLANEGDREAERLLGVALAMDDQVELGIALIARAYRGNPELAFSPLTRETVDSLAAWRGVQRDIQRYATVRRTGSAWLAAIAITQDELPLHTHEDRLENARRAGLHPDVVDAFQRFFEGGEPRKPPVETTAEPVQQAETEAEGTG
ncbi:MAG: tetratricopeptide repeat protein [Phycisphaerales bacterium]